jgi:hypothetical protein
MQSVRARILASLLSFHDQLTFPPARHSTLDHRNSHSGCQRRTSAPSFEHFDAPCSLTPILDRRFPRRAPLAPLSLSQAVPAHVSSLLFFPIRRQWDLCAPPRSAHLSVSGAPTPRTASDGSWRAGRTTAEPLPTDHTIQFQVSAFHTRVPRPSFHVCHRSGLAWTACVYGCD